MTRTLMTSLILAALVATPLTAQQPEASAVADKVQEKGGLQVLDDSQVALSTYRPRHTRAKHLLEGLSSVYGVHFKVRGDGGGVRGPLSNLFVSGDVVGIYDTKARRGRILEAARELDESNAEGPDPDPQVLRYRPRHASTRSLEQALKLNAYRWSPTGYLVQEAQTMSDTGLLLVGTPDPERVRRILEDLDQPRPRAPQLVLTFFVVERTTEAGTDGLPQELVTNLQALMPTDGGFRVLGTGALHTTAAGHERVEVKMVLRRPGGGSSGQAKIDLRVDNYDQQQGVLSLSTCVFQVSRNMEKQSFSTSASLTMGHYMVLGGMGASPVFLVLRAQPGS